MTDRPTNYVNVNILYEQNTKSYIDQSITPRRKSYSGIFLNGFRRVNLWLEAWQIGWKYPFFSFLTKKSFDFVKCAYLLTNFSSTRYGITKPFDMRYYNNQLCIFNSLNNSFSRFSPLSKNVLRFLKYFHDDKRNAGLQTMIARLYAPFLWRYVKVKWSYRL